MRGESRTSDLGTTEAATGSARLHFSARDLVNVAIFVVIYIVQEFAIGMLGVISPLVWLLLVPVIIIVGGIVYTLFCTRVKHPGMATLFGILVALFYQTQGHPLVGSVAIVGLAVIADVILWLGKYRSKWAVIGAYTIFSLGFYTPFLPLVWDREAYFGEDVWKQMGAEYVQAANALFTGPVLAGLVGVVLVAGFLGGLLGSALLKKHFVRAGLA